MKKIYHLIILAIGLFNACSPQTEELFDKSSDVRMNEALQRYKELLVSSPDGWLVQYYPHSGRLWGGFNLFFQFTEDEVTIKTEVQSPILTVDESTSLYSLKQDMGPTLNFDVYNEVFNYFSDPALNVGLGTGFGYEGDYEFVIISGDASEIVLQGKKTKNFIRMTPAPTEGWDAYVAKTREMKYLFSAPTITLSVDGKEISDNISQRPGHNLIVFEYAEEAGAEPEEVVISYVTTPTGILLYEPLTINNVTVQNLTYDAVSEQMVSEDGKVVFSLVFPPLDDYFMNSLPSTRWYLSTDGVGSGFLPTFNTMKSGFVAIGESLHYAWIGPSIQQSLPSFSFGAFEPGVQTWYGSFVYEITKIGADKIKIEVTGERQVNANYYTNLIPSLLTFAELLGGEYDITTADIRTLESITLTSPTDANKTITLTRSEVAYP